MMRAYKFGARSRSRRSSQRGAILIESLIVCSLLITVMICGLFLHRLYAAKLRAVREARLRVWQAADSAGCGGTPIDLRAIAEEAVTGLGTPFGAGSGSVGAGLRLGRVGGSTSAPAFLGAIAHRNQTSTASASSHPRIGGGTYRLSVSNQLACNEQVAAPRGDVLSVFGFAARNVIGPVWSGL